MDNNELRLGCKVYELEIGTEFSCDEGRTWLVVRTEPKYVSKEAECLTLTMMCSPEESTEWREIRLEDSDHVLLEKNWRG